MKRFATVLLALFVAYPMIAQENNGNNGAVTSDVSLTGQGSRDRLIFQFTFDNWFHQENLTNGQDFEVEWFSRGVNIYFMYDMLLGDDSRFSFAPGIGYGHSSIFMNAEIGQDTATSSAEFRPEPEKGIDGREIRDFKTSKLALNYLEIPVEFRYRSKPNKKGNSFKVAFGFKAGWLFDDHTKMKYDVDEFTSDDTITKKVKEKNLENVFSFRYGPTFRIGYSSLNLIAYYGLSEVFDDGPDVTPVAIGISFNGL